MNHIFCAISEVMSEEMFLRKSGIPSGFIVRYN